NSREWNSKVYLMGRKVRRGRPRLPLRSARLRILLQEAQEGAGANDPSLLRAEPVSRRALASRRPVAAANASFRHSRWACSCGLRCPSQEYPATESPKDSRPTLVPRARTTSACRRQAAEICFRVAAFVGSGTARPPTDKGVLSVGSGG